MYPLYSHDFLIAPAGIGIKMIFADILLIDHMK